MRAHCGIRRGGLVAKQDLHALRTRGVRVARSSPRRPCLVRADGSQLALGETLLSATTQLGIAYEYSLRTHPILTNATTAGTLYTLSDIYAQTHQAKFDDDQTDEDQEYEASRYIRYGVFGLCDGTVSYFWFQWLDSVVATDNAPLAFAEMMTADFTLLSPAWTAVFLFYSTVATGRSLGEGTDRVRREWKELYTRTVVTWFPLNAIVYGLVPLDRRVLAFATFTFMYTIVLSLWAERNADKGLPEDASVKVKI